MPLLTPILSQILKLNLILTLKIAKAVTNSGNRLSKESVKELRELVERISASASKVFNGEITIKGGIASDSKENTSLEDFKIKMIPGW